MRYVQKPQTIEAFTFPVAINVSLPDVHGTRDLPVPYGDYLLFIDGDISVMTKKEFHAKHDEVNEHVGEAKSRDQKPKKKPKASKYGLKAPVFTAESLRQQPSVAEPNGGVEQEA